MINEVAVWHQCAKETKVSSEFPYIPLKVLARDLQYCISNLVEEGVPRAEAELWENTWHELIVEQAMLSERGELITACHAAHSIYEDRPDIIIKEIHELIQLCHKAELN